MRSGKNKIRSFVILLFLSCRVFAQNAEERVLFDSANAAYARNDFEKAIRGYNAILDKGKASAALYYNLGNAYYKTNNIGLAILNYERSKKLKDGDEELEANLKLAQQRTEDRIDKAPELFLKEWKKEIADLMGERSWSLLCIAVLCLTLLLFLLYVFSRQTGLRKTGFFGGSVFLLLTIVLFFIAKYKYETTLNSAEAIITTGTVTVNGSPDEQGTKLFLLHEGTKVTIQQENDGWSEIRIANGNVGWIKSDTCQKI
ncbi:MAG: tetratricopeptide repeat protein [Bacteroidia bacterium]